MKATKKEIEDYFIKIYNKCDLDWYGYMSLIQLRDECITKGELVLIKI